MNKGRRAKHKCSSAGIPGRIFSLMERGLSLRVLSEEHLKTEYAAVMNNIVSEVTPSYRL